MHSYLCMQLLDETWVAISPANFDSTKEKSRSNYIIVSTSYTDLSSLDDPIYGPGMRKSSAYLSQRDHNGKYIHLEVQK